MKIVILILLGCYSVIAQDTLSEKRLQYRGYIKYLPAIYFQPDLTNPTTGNLIHHRLNLKWDPSKRITTAIEMRNRLFWGDQVRVTPNFSSQLQNLNETLNLSHNWLDESDVVLNSTLDRLWIEYHTNKWNIRLGRQRINWGLGTMWNPNDLFNTYNFLDFDYEERPGADAIKIQYLTSPMNHIEFAMSAVNDYSKTIGALKYFVNVSGYDLQLITGWYLDQPTIGLGWSGSVNEMGFKGEAQYYFPRSALAEQFNISIESDYVFESGWFISAGMLFNSTGIYKQPTGWEVISYSLTPKNLMPTRWNTVFSINKELTPLFLSNINFVYAPGTNLLIILPSLSYSLTDNFDLSLVWQSFFIEQQTAGFDDLSHRVFLRLKWSY